MPSEKQRLQAVKLQKKVDGLRRELIGAITKLTLLDERLKQAHKVISWVESQSCIGRVLMAEEKTLRQDFDNALTTIYSLGKEIEIAQESLEELVSNA